MRCHGASPARLLPEKSRLASAFGFNEGLDLDVEDNPEGPLPTSPGARTPDAKVLLKEAAPRASSYGGIGSSSESSSGGARSCGDDSDSTSSSGGEEGEVDRPAGEASGVPIAGEVPRDSDPSTVLREVGVD